MDDIKTHQRAKKQSKEVLSNLFPIGKEINSWTIVSEAYYKKRKSGTSTELYVLCKCKCGMETEQLAHRVRKGNISKCRRCWITSAKKERNVFTYNEELDAYITVLKNNNILIVDKIDIEKIEKYRWYLVKYNHTNYAKCTSKPILLQNFLPIEEGFVWDHRNHNGLDNRRCNLRKCTNKENMLNRRKAKNRKCSSKFLGVSFNKNDRKWVASVILKGKFVFRKRYNTEIEAAFQRDQAAKIFHSKFAHLNFPESIKSVEEAIMYEKENLK